MSEGVHAPEPMEVRRATFHNLELWLDTPCDDCGDRGCTHVDVRRDPRPVVSRPARLCAPCAVWRRWAEIQLRAAAALHKILIR